jgi:hypothetical protein
VRRGRLLAWFGALVALAVGSYAVAFRNSLQLLLPITMPARPPVERSTLQSPAIFPAKLWLHRVNSSERARVMGERFRGLEVDVHFVAGCRCFTVGHSVGDFVGESIREVFRAAGGVKPSFWLDMKNLDSTNAGAVLAHLIELRDEFELDGRLIVESPRPELLSHLTDAGFYTSYYLPTIDPREASGPEILAHVDTVARRLARSRVNAISGYHFQHRIMRKYFPEADLLLWDMGRSRVDIFARLYRRRLLADPHLRVLLVRRHSPGYR